MPLSQMVRNVTKEQSYVNMMAPLMPSRVIVVFGSSLPHQLFCFLKIILKVGPLWQNFLDSRMKSNNPRWVMKVGLRLYTQIFYHITFKVHFNFKAVDVCYILRLYLLLYIPLGSSLNGHQMRQCLIWVRTVCKSL